MGTLLGRTHGAATPGHLDDEELLVALHGLGGTGEVWTPMFARLRDPGPGWWWGPDLAGHGATGTPLPDYTFRGMAEDIAARLPPARSYVVIGHSLGGVIGLELAAIVPEVRRVVGLGIKVHWTDEELAGARALAARPVVWFDVEADAVARHRKVSGLGDLVEDDIARAGVVKGEGGWRLALDPKTFAVGRPEMRGLVDGAVNRGVEVVLVRGELDPMQTDEQLRALVPESHTLRGRGHQAHLEDPAAVLSLV